MAHDPTAEQRGFAVYSNLDLTPAAPAAPAAGPAGPAVAAGSAGPARPAGATDPAGAGGSPAEPKVLRFELSEAAQSALASLSARSATRPETWDDLAKIHRSRCPKKDLREAIYWDEEDPLVYACNRVLAQLANSRLTLRCESETKQELFQSWFDDAMPHDFRSTWFTQLAVVGMAATIKTLIPYVPKDYNPGRAPRKLPPPEAGDGPMPGLPVASYARADDPADELDEAATRQIWEDSSAAYEDYCRHVRAYEDARASRDRNLCSPRRLRLLEARANEALHVWLDRSIPGAYGLLNPLSIDYRGPENLPMIQQPYLSVDGDVLRALQDPTPETRHLVEALPVELTQQIRTGRAGVFMAPHLFNITYLEKPPYRRYPVPIAKRAFRALRAKYKFIAADEQLADNIKSAIQLIRLGNDNFYTADRDQMQQVGQIIKAGGATQQLVWNHLLQIDWIQPDSKPLEENVKIEHCNREIRTAWRISEAITGTSTSTGTLSGGDINAKGIEDNVEQMQKLFLQFAQAEVDRVRAALRIQEPVTLEFDRLNLKDPAEYAATMAKLVMNGILDVQTVLEHLNFHFPTVKKRMKAMQAMREEGLFMPTPSANNLGPDGQVTGPEGGKPASDPGADNNRNKAGKPQPKSASAAGDPLLPPEPVFAPAAIARAASDAMDQTSRHYQFHYDGIVDALRRDAEAGGKRFYLTQGRREQAEREAAGRVERDLKVAIGPENEPVPGAIAAVSEVVRVLSGITRDDLTGPMIELTARFALQLLQEAEGADEGGEGGEGGD